MIRKPTIHRMDRRSEFKNYMLPGIYHITVKAAETLRMPFGKVVGNIDKKDGINYDKLLKSVDRIRRRMPINKGFVWIILYLTLSGIREICPRPFRTLLLHLR